MVHNHSTVSLFSGRVGSDGRIQDTNKQRSFVFAVIDNFEGGLDGT